MNIPESLRLAARVIVPEFGSRRNVWVTRLEVPGEKLYSIAPFLSISGSSARI
ncbi:hypothetical protein DPMN_104301 [Dreissena polymorpha]|uniref:Uncharacterized protein n=1 Tax=Dreissena polymorpha TaxID=45954 RepID=A0A9D4HCT5_DREPO|nr:hypothetical protein DPMN_104301 [Dreissena polymorpha]